MELASDSTSNALYSPLRVLYNFITHKVLYIASYDSVVSGLIPSVGNIFSSYYRVDISYTIRPHS